MSMMIKQAPTGAVVTNTTSDEEIVTQGVQMLTSALASGQVRRSAIETEQARDIALVTAREWLGDNSNEQRLITRGIKLRVEARRRVLESAIIKPAEQPTR